MDNHQCFPLQTTRMPEITAIQFTQDQARTLTSVSAETVRHWRKAIPYLSSKTGKAARFTFADLLGLAITHELVNSFGVHIATMSTGVDALFRLLTASSPAAQDGAIVFITSTEATLYEAGAGGMGQVPAKPALMIPLAPLIAKIQRYMLPVMPVSSQTVLPFPPEAVRSRA
ncbi:MAG: hypothetical protein ACYDE0_15050 [Acidiferrobacterales bacterium]